MFFEVLSEEYTKLWGHNKRGSYLFNCAKFFWTTNNLSPIVVSLQVTTFFISH